MTGQFIVSESEKKQIRLLYEVNKPLPQASNFVKTLAKHLDIDPSTIIGLDWSLYKNNKTYAFLKKALAKTNFF